MYPHGIGFYIFTEMYNFNSSPQIPHMVASKIPQINNCKEKKVPTLLSHTLSAWSEERDDLAT